MFWLSGWLRGWDIRPSSRKDSSELKERQQEALEKEAERIPLRFISLRSKNLFLAKLTHPKRNYLPCPFILSKTSRTSGPFNNLSVRQAELPSIPLSVFAELASIVLPIWYTFILLPTW
jgi:hypothetical protein